MKKSKLRIKIEALINNYVQHHPELVVDLLKSNSKYEPADFVKRTVISSLYMSAGLVFFVFLLMAKAHKNTALLIFLFPLLWFLLFNLYIRSPSVMTKKLARKLDSEVVFATQFLIIEIKSGVPLYQAFINVSRNFKEIGKVFAEIIQKVNTGDDMEKAIAEAISKTPSNYLRNILSQILNTMSTGADLSIPLTSVLDQVVREQLISLNEYSRKLNPLSMFYMMMAVIVPTLGITMLIVLSTFLNFQLSFTILVILALFFAFIQLMFYTIIKSNRPAVEL